MWRKVLALLGLLIFISGIVFVTVEISQQQQTTELRTGPMARVLADDYMAVIIAGIGLFLGPLLTIPWWWQRLSSEEEWFEKRDEAVKGSPRAN